MHFRYLLAVVCCLLSTTSLADDKGLSVEVTGVTDYISRGISQNAHHPSAQAQIEYAWPNGLYVQLFAASVHVNDAHVETDESVGYRGEAGALTYDVGVIGTYYPGTNQGAYHNNFFELYDDLTYDLGRGLKWAGSMNVSPNGQGNVGPSLYLNSGLDYELRPGLTLGARLGRLMVSNPSATGQPNYFDWNLTLSYDLTEHVSVALFATGTSLGRIGCGGTDFCGNRIGVSMTAKF